MSDEEGPSGAEAPDGPHWPADTPESDGPRASPDATASDGRADSGGPSGTGGSDREPDPAAPENPTGLREWVRWFRTTDREAVIYLRELATSVGAVLAIGLLLFLISGVWPPMVAVESASMEPHMGVGDLVFVMEEDRLSPEYGHETGVVTHRVGEQHGYRKFGAPGDVIIYRPNGRGGTPIIHRAMFWVVEGENWCDKADPQHISDRSECSEADHSGFITKGDNTVTNGEYDQVNGLSAPVKPAWIVGTAEASIPLLGYVKLCTSSGPCFLVAAPVGQASAAPGAVPTAPSAGEPAATAGDRTTAGEWAATAGDLTLPATPETTQAGANASEAVLDASALRTAAG